MNKFSKFLFQFIDGYFTFFGMFCIVVLFMTDGFMKGMEVIGQVLMIYIGLILSIIVLLMLLIVIWGVIRGVKEYIKKRGC